MRRLITGLAIATTVIAVACGKNATPTAPTTAGSVFSASAPGGPGPSLDASASTAEVKGVVSAIPPTTAALTFMAAGKTIVTNASTTFTKGSATVTFAAITLGEEIEAHGTLSGTTLTATRVEVEEAEEEPEPAPAPAPNQPPMEAELSGVVAGLTGTASSFQFTIGSVTVMGSQTTTFTGDSNAVKTFADLINGATVEVKGVQQTGVVQAARIQIEGPENEPGDNQGPGDNKGPGKDGEVDLRGSLGAVTGTCPAITSSIGTTMFTTSSATRFDDGGCAALTAGKKVEVKGTRNADGSVTATRVQKE